MQLPKNPETKVIIDDLLFKEWILKRNKELIERLRRKKQKRAIQRKKDS